MQERAQRDGEYERKRKGCNYSVPLDRAEALRWRAELEGGREKSGGGREG